MTEEFLRKLLSESNFQLEDSTFDKRLKAIMKYSKMKQGLLIKALDLIRLVFQLSFDPTNIDEFRKYIIDADSQYPTQTINFDLKVLATAALCYIIDNNPPQISTTLSLAVVNCYGFGLRSKPRNLNIINFSESSLRNQLIQSRNIPKVGHFASNFDISETFLSEFKAAVTQNQPANQSEAIKEMVADLGIRLNSFSQNIYKLLAYKDSQYQILREESDILWWIMANYSRRYQKAWSTLDPLEGCLVIGKELADLALQPGPLTYEDLIKGVLKCYGDKLPQLTTIEKVIAKIPNDRRKSLIERNPLISDLTPLHYAIKTSLEHEFEDSWSENIKKVQINSSRRLSPISYATQIYRESIYLKMNNEGD
jgi:hypothetical protein